MFRFISRWWPIWLILCVFLLFSYFNQTFTGLDRCIIGADKNFDYGSRNLSELQINILQRVKVKAVQNIMNDTSLAVDIWLNKGKWELPYDNALLVDFFRETRLFLPDKSLPYNLTSTSVNPSEGQIQAVWHLLQNVTDGFFIDCGAHDGEFISNTLWLEKEHNWTGILIEADPMTFKKLQSKNRKAWHANVGLSTSILPKKTSFFRNPTNTGMNGINKREQFGVNVEIQIQCFPLYTILLALNRQVVDFFSLDIEGLELEVLKTIPFDKIIIKTFAIEHWSIPEGAAGLEKFMTQKGYVLYTTITTGLSRDSIFVLESLLPKGFRLLNSTNLSTNAAEAGWRPAHWWIRHSRIKYSGT